MFLESSLLDLFLKLLQLFCFFMFYYDFSEMFERQHTMC